MSARFRLFDHFNLILTAISATFPALAAPPEYLLAIENHRFVPSELTIPAGEKVRLRIENHDATPEEFESHELNREKLISGRSSAVVFVGPLKAGSYHFFGEFNEDTAQGRLVVE
jgi:plastocyanin